MEARTAELNQSLSGGATEQGKRIIKERLARLSGKMARIMVGGNTEIDIFENRDRLVDGLNAVKNAIKTVRRSKQTSHSLTFLLLLLIRESCQVEALV